MCRGILGLALAALFLPGAHGDEPEDKALALVKKLGGKAYRDQKQ